MAVWHDQLVVPLSTYPAGAGGGSPSKKAKVRFRKYWPSRNLHSTREKTRQRAHLILKPWKRGGLEDFSPTKEGEMTAATFDHQVGKALEFFDQRPSSARSSWNQPGPPTGIQERILSGTNAQNRAYDQWGTLCKVWT
jgi:hypothetical protein